MTDRISMLAETVQKNCNVSDARHGKEYTLCTYLMKMREYYRWERGLPFEAQLPRQDLGEWLSRREELWGRLEESDFEPLSIDGDPYDPFDVQGVNQALSAYGLVYSGGLGHNAKPHFCLAALERKNEFDGFSVFVSGREYARDLTAPPAMTREDIIFVRRESLRRMLWEKLETWRWSRPDNALGRALSCYRFESELETSLDEMTEQELASVVLHERGEFACGHLLGGAWNRMLLDLSATPAELAARAVRDHWADCSVTLPRLLREGRSASIHFFMGNLTHMRKQIFPALGKAYQAWQAQAAEEPMLAVAAEGARHWSAVASAILQLHAEDPAAAAHEIQLFVQQNHL